VSLLSCRQLLSEWSCIYGSILELAIDELGLNE
jgi:hypothetical protein